VADPALLFQDDADRAGTHVLLIGIGNYPWLEGGSKYTAAENETNAKGMGQLPAPPISMRRLADWFFDKFNNDDHPLASVALILSEAAPSAYEHARCPGRTEPQPSGTIADIKSAVAAWLGRASGRRDNNLVFAFCGHGLQSGNPVLLCTDYGEEPENPFNGAIDFEQYRIALSTRQPDRQLIFVDACRTPDLETVLLGQASPGDALIGVKSLTDRDNAPAIQSVHFATSLYTEAWGRNDGPSLFTESLIKALDGGAAEHTAGWWVTTSRLHTVLSTYLQRTGAKEGVVQRPAAQTQDFPINKPGPISVDLYVTSPSSEIWDERLKIQAKRGAAVAKEVDHDPASPAPFLNKGPLLMPLVNPTQNFADVVYDIHAVFPQDSKFHDCVEAIIAYPPEVACQLPVSKKP
jgi:Caspase domain